MSELSPVNQQEFFTGREGLQIPRLDQEDILPNELLGFFRDMFSENMWEFGHMAFSYGTRHRVFPRLNLDDEELALPGSAEKPLVVMRYKQTEVGHNLRETHTVLTAPEKIGRFQKRIEVSTGNPDSPTSSVHGLEVDFEGQKTRYAKYEPESEWHVSNQEFPDPQPLDDGDYRFMRTIINEFVELAS